MSESSYVPQRNDLPLGAYVKTRNHGHIGRIYNKHLSCPESLSWFNGLVPALPQETYNQPWVSILTHNPHGGAGGVVVPESDVEVIDRFIFKHRDRDTYFPADDEDDLIDAETEAALTVMEYDVTVRVTTLYRFKTEVSDFQDMHDNIKPYWDKAPSVGSWNGPTSEGTETVELVSWDRIK